MIIISICYVAKIKLNQCYPHLCNGNWTSYKDHTNQQGLMLIVNGASTPDKKVWQQVVAVTPNTRYQFYGWSASAYPGSPSTLRFFINNTKVGNDFALTSTTAQWRQFIVNWNSGSNVSATIKIVDINLDFDSNDFTLDDLVFDANVSQYFGVTDITDVNNDGIIDQALLVLKTGNYFCEQLTVLLAY